MVGNGVRGLLMNEEKIEYDPKKHIDIAFIEKLIHRDICLVYRGCLLMLLEKWREENE